MTNCSKNPLQDQLLRLISNDQKHSIIKQSNKHSNQGNNYIDSISFMFAPGNENEPIREQEPTNSCTKSAILDVMKCY